MKCLYNIITKDISKTVFQIHCVPSVTLLCCCKRQRALLGFFLVKLRSGGSHSELSHGQDSGDVAGRSVPSNLQKGSPQHTAK